MTLPPRGVLITGATTPIGERLVRALLADSAVQAVLAVALESEDAALPISDPRLVYRSVDLSHSRRAHNLLFGLARDLGVEVVVHTALHRSIHAKGARVHSHNVEALRTLIDLGERHPTIRRLVFRSFGEVYRVRHDLPGLVNEDHPLNMAPDEPQWVRDRVEADLTACARMGLYRMEIAVLRFAEVLAPGTGSQLFDYLEGPVCLRPLGFDPMINVISLTDSVRALDLAARAFGRVGVYNIPGADTLPLSECIRAWGMPDIPMPGSLLSLAYRARRKVRGNDFSYGMNRRRFHYCNVLDGQRAEEELGYVPQHPVDWPGRP